MTGDERLVLQRNAAIADVDNGSTDRGGIPAFHQHTDLTLVDPLMAVEQPLPVELILNMVHQTFEQPPARRIDEQVAETRRGEHVGLFEHRLTARQRASITGDQRNPGLLREYQPEWLKLPRVHREDRRDRHSHGIAVERLADNDATARRGPRGRWRAAIAIEDRDREPGVVDTNPGASANWIDRHDRRTRSEAFDARLERDRSIAPLVAIRHQPEPIAVGNNRHRAHHIAPFCFLGVAGAKPRRSGTSRPARERSTAIIAW